MTQKTETVLAPIPLDKATETLTEFDQVKKSLQVHFLHLGRLLREIKDNLYYKVRGYDNFKHFVEAELDFGWRRAFYLAQLVEKLETLGLLQVAMESGHGVTSLQTILCLDDKAEVERLLAAPASPGEVRERVASIKGVIPDGDLWHVYHIPVSAEQKGVIEEALWRAKVMGNTDSLGQAMEYICADFISDPNNQPNLEGYRYKHILERDGYLCQFNLPGCTGHDQLTAFHINPKSAGGTDNADNLITACSNCHTKKEKKIK